MFMNVVITTVIFLNAFLVANGTIVVPLIPHRPKLSRTRTKHRQLHARLEENQKSHHGKQIHALYQGYGTHYVDLWCGTPPQRRTVIVDTGSSITSFPCQGCENCGDSYHTDTVFEQSLSATFQEVTCDEESACTSSPAKCHSDLSSQQCQVHQQYTDDSGWWGFEARDRCYLGGFHNIGISKTDVLDISIDPMDAWDPANADRMAVDDMLFGCQTRATGLYRVQLADGMLGMDASSDSYWNILYEAGKLDERKFSLCFSRQPLQEKTGTEAGGMTLGGSDSRWHDTRMQYSRLSLEERNNFFGVKLRRMLLESPAVQGRGNRSLASRTVQIDIDEETLNHHGVIVDSGTTDTFMDSGIQVAFQAAYKELTGEEWDQMDYKQSLTLDELRALPTIIFQLEGATRENPVVARGDPNLRQFDPNFPDDVFVVFPPTHYMELLEATHEQDNDERVYTRGFHFGGFGTVLGANLMMGHDVEFDMENHLMGWAESSCNYTSFVTHDFRGGEQYQREAEKSQGLVDESQVKRSKFAIGTWGIGALICIIVVAGLWITRQRTSSTTEAPTVELELEYLEDESDIDVAPKFQDEHCEKFEDEL